MSGIESLPPLLAAGGGWRTEAGTSREPGQAVRRDQRQRLRCPVHPGGRPGLAGWLWLAASVLLAAAVLVSCSGEDAAVPGPRPAAGPDPVDLGWILLDSDRAHVSTALRRAVDYGADHVQLSHDLVMDIDEINRDEARAALIQDVAREAHGLGLEVWVWSHEFSGESYLLCLDPGDPLWERRRQAYRQALARVPEIDGVVLMFGSAEVEPWYAVCLCDWCQGLPPTGNPVLDLIHSRPVDRLRQIYAEVGGVVLDEFGRKLRLRTFMHQVWELGWLGESLRDWPDPRLAVMTKDVPQDWQPYYPDDPLIGDVGDREQIVEMDLGNEYWGLSRILNGQVDYLAHRIGYGRAAGVAGAAARIERGSDHALGNPNEVNLYAFTRLWEDENATPDLVYREWCELRYGLAPASRAAAALKQVLRNSHYAMRKMYYTLGMWTLEKGSDLPDRAGYPEQLWQRSTAWYDGRWLGVFLALAFPTGQTLADLWQESEEARELALDNLRLLESVEADFGSPADYAELHEMLALHEDQTRIWQLVKDAVFRLQVGEAGDQAPFLEHDAGRLTELADEMEQRWGASVRPGSPARVRAFVGDLRGRFPAGGAVVPWSQPRLYDIGAERLDDERCLIRWRSDELLSSRVEWGEELPLYEHESGESVERVSEHAVEIEVPRTGAPQVFRVSGRTAAGVFVRSGDFWLDLD